jgi:hypothetical protein
MKFSCGRHNIPIFAKWRSKRERRPFRVACADIARIGGCGGLDLTYTNLASPTVEHCKSGAVGEKSANVFRVKPSSERNRIKMIA